MRQAVILVGGRGTRLGAFAKDTPKPLLPIDGDRRFLDYLIENVARHGFREVILLAGHLGEQVEARYHGERLQDCEIKVVREPEPAGTGGALLFARGLLDPVFLMLNGDSFFDFNFLALTGALEPNDLGALALRRIDDARRYGVVEHASGRALKFREKDPSLRGEAWISGGVYLLRREVLDQMGPPPVSIEVDVFPAAAATGRLACGCFDGYFIDIGLPETLAQGRRELPRVRRRPAILFSVSGAIAGARGSAVHPAELSWRPGVVDAIRSVNDAGWLAVVADPHSRSRDGGSSYSLGDRMYAELTDAGAHVDAVYWRPINEWPSETAGSQIDAGPSFLVSSDDHDLAAARAAGLTGVRHVGGDLGPLIREIVAAGSNRDFGIA